jgi:hypothetical protein
MFFSRFAPQGDDREMKAVPRSRSDVGAPEDRQWTSWRHGVSSCPGTFLAVWSLRLEDYAPHSCIACNHRFIGLFALSHLC